MKIFSLLSVKLKNPYGLLAFFLATSALVIGFLTRIIACFQYITYDIGPAPDQIRDAFIYMNMWEGKLPTLGPGSSIGGYSLPPLYYYLVFPFTILGANLEFQVLPNALFSFLSIILLTYFLYQILAKLGTSLENNLVLSALGGLWYSTFYGEIFINNFQWNPGPIIFFSLLFLLLYEFQYSSQNSTYKSLNHKIAWIVYGIVLAILVSLHSTTLFIMPVVFFVSLVMFIYKKRNIKKDWLLPLFSIISSLIVLFPYWQGEIPSKFANTKKIINTVLNSSGESGGLIEKLFSSLTAYLQLGQQAYFVSYASINIIISLIFFSIITYFGIKKVRNGNILLIFSILIFTLFLLASSSFTGSNFHYHYKLLILIIPIIFTVITLAQTKIDQDKKQLVLTSLIILSIIYSLFTNLYFDSKFWDAKYGKNRIMSTNDIVEIFNQLPEGQTICGVNLRGSRKKINTFNYIDKYITQKNFNLVTKCNSGDFLISPKQIMIVPVNYLWPIFSKVEIPQQKDQQIYLETETAYVYLR